MEVSWVQFVHKPLRFVDRLGQPFVRVIVDFSSSNQAIHNTVRAFSRGSDFPITFRTTTRFGLTKRHSGAKKVNQKSELYNTPLSILVGVAATTKK